MGIRIISWKIAILQGLIVGIVGFLFFLVIEVAIGQILKDTLITLYGSGLTVILLFILFLANLGIGLLTTRLTSENLDIIRALFAGVFAFLGNLLGWFLVSFIYIKVVYPDTIANLSLWEKLIAIPRLFGYFVVYGFSHISLFWAIAQLTFGGFYTRYLK